MVKYIHEYNVTITVKYPFWDLTPTYNWEGKIQSAKDIKLGGQPYKEYVVVFPDEQKARQFSSMAGASPDVRKIKLDLGKPKAKIEFLELSPLDYDMIAAAGMQEARMIITPLEESKKAVKGVRIIQRKQIGGYDLVHTRTLTGCSIKLYRITQAGGRMRVGTWSGVDPYECKRKFGEIVEALT